MFLMVNRFQIKQINIGREKRKEGEREREEGMKEIGRKERRKERGREGGRDTGRLEPSPTRPAYLDDILVHGLTLHQL